MVDVKKKKKNKGKRVKLKSRIVRLSKENFFWLSKY